MIKGERLGFPTLRSMGVLFYNADWARQLGYDGPPKDWKLFEEMACKADAKAILDQVVKKSNDVLKENAQVERGDPYHS